MKGTKLYVVDGVYFLIHSFRNLLQFFEVDNVLTNLGHGFGVWYTDWLLSLIGLSYDRKMEIYFFAGEFMAGLLLIWSAKRSGNEN